MKKCENFALRGKIKQVFTFFLLYTDRVKEAMRRDNLENDKYKLKILFILEK